MKSFFCAALQKPGSPKKQCLNQNQAAGVKPSAVFPFFRSADDYFRLKAGYSFIIFNKEMTLLLKFVGLIGKNKMD